MAGKSAALLVATSLILAGSAPYATTAARPAGDCAEGGPMTGAARSLRTWMETYDVWSLFNVSDGFSPQETFCRSFRFPVDCKSGFADWQHCSVHLRSDDSFRNCQKRIRSRLDVCRLRHFLYTLYPEIYRKGDIKGYISRLRGVRTCSLALLSVCSESDRSQFGDPTSLLLNFTELRHAANASVYLPRPPPPPRPPPEDGTTSNAQFTLPFVGVSTILLLLVAVFRARAQRRWYSQNRSSLRDRYDVIDSAARSLSGREFRRRLRNRSNPRAGSASRNAVDPPTPRPDDQPPAYVDLPDSLPPRPYSPSPQSSPPPYEFVLREAAEKRVAEAAAPSRPEVGLRVQELLALNTRL